MEQVHWASAVIIAAAAFTATDSVSTGTHITAAAAAVVVTNFAEYKMKLWPVYRTNSAAAAVTVFTTVA